MNESLLLLSNLIQVNNERITQYQKAIQATQPQDEELRHYFNILIQESRQFRQALGRLLILHGGSIEYKPSGTSTSTEDDPNAQSSGWQDTEMLLAHCEKSEAAVLDDYDAVLDQHHLLKFDMQRAIVVQRESIRRACQTIGNLLHTAQEKTAQ